MREVINMTTTSLDNFYSKFLDYKIYLPESKKMVNLAEQEALWFKTTGDHPDVVEYANAVENSSSNPISTMATLAFGDVGFDKATITADTGEVYNMVLSPEEYYFTDMVFMKQEYEQALVDLCCYKAILFPNSEEEAVADRIKAIDEAILNTKWVAEQNGVVIDDNKIKQKIREYVENETEEKARNLTNYIGDYFPNAKKNISLFIESLVQYYLDPNKNTEAVVLDRMRNIGNLKGIGIRTGIYRIVNSLSIGLAMALDRKLDNNKYLTQLAPVEIGAREQKVNFK